MDESTELIPKQNSDCYATTEATPPEPQSPEDIALTEKIKRDWYEKTWKTENPKANTIKSCLVIVNVLVIIIGFVLLAFAFYKFSTLDDTLRKTDILLLTTTYNDYLNSMYILIIFGGLFLIIGFSEGDFIRIWADKKLLEWHDNLKLDTRQIAVDVVLIGKSHKMYNYATAYLYNKTHNNYLFRPRLSLKTAIISLTILSGLFIALITYFCFLLKDNAEKILHTILLGSSDIPTVSTTTVTSSGPDTTTIIFMVLLVLLIIALLVVPYITNKNRTKKIDAWIAEQIKNGSFKAANK